MVLYSLLNLDLNLVEEFFDVEGRFYAEETKPPHEKLRGENEMDVDDEHIKTRRAAFSTEETLEMFGLNPHAESQLF